MKQYSRRHYHFFDVFAPVNHGQIFLNFSACLITVGKNGNLWNVCKTKITTVTFMSFEGQYLIFFMQIMKTKVLFNPLTKTVLSFLFHKFPNFWNSKIIFGHFLCPTLKTVSVCVGRWLLSPYAGFKRWNGVFPGLEVSTSVLIRDHDSSTNLCSFLVSLVKFIH